MSKENIQDVVFKFTVEQDLKNVRYFLKIKETPIESLSTELKIPATIKHPDLILSTKEGIILHIEFQSTRNVQKDYERFHMYDTLLYECYHKPIKTIVIYTCPVNDPEAILDANVIKYKPELILLKNQDSDKIFENINQKIKKSDKIEDYEFLELIKTLFMAGSLSEKERIFKIIEISKKHIKYEKLKKDILITILNFSKIFFNETEFKEIMKVMPIKLESDRIFERGIKQGIKKGKEQGIEQ
ncbi:MAG: hypothetical protein Q4Q23_02575 [Methanobacteriaceae archaeon]|nr:hypothetical protein [Methanobacteriaceae archaeon]